MNERPRRLRVDVLLLAAHPLELAPFAQALGAGMAAELHGLRVAAADVGVGLPSAGPGAASPRAATVNTPTKPTAAAGIGSATRPVITPMKMAK